MTGTVSLKMLLRIPTLLLFTAASVCGNDGLDDLANEIFLSERYGDSYGEDAETVRIKANVHQILSY